LARRIQTLRWNPVVLFRQTEVSDFEPKQLLSPGTTPTTQRAHCLKNFGWYTKPIKITEQLFSNLKNPLANQAPNATRALFGAALT